MVTAAKEIERLRNPCAGDCEAKDFQVEEYLLGQVKKVLCGEEQEAIIASYEVGLKNGGWRCLMPEEVKINGENLSVSERQWTRAAGMILLRLGHNFNVLHEKYEEDLRVGRKKSTEETVYPIISLAGELAELAAQKQFEVVIAGKVVREKRGWQILVRRKVDE
jgi:hypothetical protein